MAYWHYASQVALWDEVDNYSWVELEIILVWWGCSISKLTSSVISRLRQAECWYPAFIIFNQKMRTFSNGEEKIRLILWCLNRCIFAGRKSTDTEVRSRHATPKLASQYPCNEWARGGGGEGIPFLSYVSQIYAASKKNHVLKTVFNFYFWVKIHLS